MAVVNPPYALQAAGIEHTAKLFRRMLQGVTSEGVANFNEAGDLKVIPSSPAAMSVRVERGLGFIQGDDTTDQGLYAAYNDGYETVTVPAADGTNPRKDLIVFQVYDNTEGQVGDTSALELVEGTPAASPSEPALPASALQLAVIDVPAGATSITSGEITDSRVSVGTETSPLLGYTERTSSQTGISGLTDLTGLTVSVDVEANRLIKVSFLLVAQGDQSDPGNSGEVRIREGSTTLQIVPFNTDASARPQFVYGFIFLTPSQGSHTYKLSMIQTSGSGTVRTVQSATEKAYIMVEDLDSV